MTVLGWTQVLALVGLAALPWSLPLAAVCAALAAGTMAREVMR